VEKVKISKDGSSIDFIQSDTLANPKKFRSSVEVESFYRFVHENDLRKEALEVIERIIGDRKAAKVAARVAVKDAKDSAKEAAKIAAKAAVVKLAGKVTKGRKNA
jgi:hypothetical protein